MRAAAFLLSCLGLAGNAHADVVGVRYDAWLISNSAACTDSLTATYANSGYSEAPFPTGYITRVDEGSYAGGPRTWLYKVHIEIETSAFSYPVARANCPLNIALPTCLPSNQSGFGVVQYIDRLTDASRPMLATRIFPPINGQPYRVGFAASGPNVPVKEQLRFGDFVSGQPFRLRAEAQFHSFADFTDCNLGTATATSLHGGTYSYAFID